MYVDKSRGAMCYSNFTKVKRWPISFYKTTTTKKKYSNNSVNVTDFQFQNFTFGQFKYLDVTCH